MGLVLVTPEESWAVILLHLGACEEGYEWARRLPVSEATINACPNRKWVVWLCKKLSVTRQSTWATWREAIGRALGYGDGDGDGNGYGNGYGNGDGNGYGADIVPV